MSLVSLVIDPSGDEEGLTIASTDTLRCVFNRSWTFNVHWLELDISTMLTAECENWILAGSFAWTGRSLEKHIM